MKDFTMKFSRFCLQRWILSIKQISKDLHVVWKITKNLFQVCSSFVRFDSQLLSIHKKYKAQFRWVLKYITNQRTFSPNLTKYCTEIIVGLLEMLSPLTPSLCHCVCAIFELAYEEDKIHGCSSIRKA